MLASIKYNLSIFFIIKGRNILNQTIFDIIFIFNDRFELTHLELCHRTIVLKKLKKSKSSYFTYFIDTFGSIQVIVPSYYAQVFAASHGCADRYEELISRPNKYIKPNRIKVKQLIANCLITLGTTRIKHQNINIQIPNELYLIFYREKDRYWWVNTINRPIENITFDTLRNIIHPTENVSFYIISSQDIPVFLSPSEISEAWGNAKSKKSLQSFFYLSPNSF
jgi:hypothetical protein